MFDIVSFFIFVGIAGGLRRKAQGILDTTPEGDQTPAEYTAVSGQSLVAMFQTFLVMFYVLLDFGFIYWVAHWFFKLPKPLNINVPMALCGFG